MSYFRTIISFFLCIVISYSKLYQTFVFFRHGARYHTNDIYDGNATYPMRSQLTPIGMRMHQNLGKIFRNLYIQKNQLLSDKYNSSQYQIYSTLYHRTIQSGVSFSYGLYPAGQGTKLPYVDRPYHLPPYASNKTDIDEQNFALPNGHQIIPIKFDNKVILKDCTNWDQLVGQVYEQRKLQHEEMNLTYYPFLKKMTQIFFKNQTQTISIAQSVDLFDTLHVDHYLGKPLPSSITQSDYDNLQHLNSWYYTFIMSKNLSHLVNTYKLKKVINECENRVRLIETYATKMTVISCHDTDIAALYTDLNISSSQCVEELYRKGKTDALNCQTDVGFASNLVIELHSNDGKGFYIMVRSNGKYVNLCEKQQTKCDYIQFRNRLKTILLNNVQDLCKH